MRGFKMTDSGRPFKEKLAFQIVRLKIEQIFEECSKFEERDKKALSEVMGNMLLQRIRSAETPTRADEGPPELIELTNASPTDESVGSSKHYTNVSSKMSGPPLVDVNTAFPE
jgi:hypothetical protein